MPISPRQRLIDEINSDDSCKECGGTGFLLIQHTSPDGYVEPNTVEECNACNGTGKRNSADKN